MSIEKIISLIENSHYKLAYELIFKSLEINPNNVELLELSKKLSACVRSQCMELACNKATEMSSKAYESEALLKAIIKLNGESIYG